jgi:hypothetical protein
MKLFLSILSLLFSITLFSQINVDVLIVGGGGGGSAQVEGSGSGGGGGQVRILTSMSVGSGVFPVVVGNGGSKGTFSESRTVQSIVAPNTKPYTTLFSGSPGGTIHFNKFN